MSAFRRATRGAGVGVVLVLACTTSRPEPEPLPEIFPPVTVRAPAPATAPAKPVAPPPSGTTGAAGPPTVLPSSRARSSDARVRDVGDTIIRVLLSSPVAMARVTSPGGVIFTQRNGSLVARGGQAEVWRMEHEGRRMRAIRPDGTPGAWIDGGIVAHAQRSALLSVGGKPYRGDLTFYGSDSGVSVVNTLKIDEYLRGVVPLEIGTRAESDSAAVQAQAITARSYAYTRLTGDPIRMYDLTGGVLDQVYGGVAAETAVSSQAVETTRALVLKYNGRIVSAPYHSTCGGATAAASEVWKAGDEPYLQSVSDRIPGTDRYYCDQAPRFRWTRVLDAATLNAALVQYLAAYAKVPGGPPGAARSVTVTSHTASGRNATMLISTSRGNFSLRGNDMRYVLRPPGGEILNSTSFTVETKAAADGSLGTLTIRGNGYGHGVGMCQSGAIGRARAGQDFRTILHTYYPGTTVAPPT